MVKKLFQINGLLVFSVLYVGVYIVLFNGVEDDDDDDDGYWD